MYFTQGILCFTSGANEPVKCATRIPRNKGTSSSGVVQFFFDISILVRRPADVAKTVVIVNYSGDIWLLWLYLFRLYVNGIKLRERVRARDQSSRTSFEFEVILVNSSPLWSFLELVYVLISRSETRQFTCERYIASPSFLRKKCTVHKKRCCLQRHFRFVILSS